VTKALVEISGGSFPSPDGVIALCFKNGGDVMVTAVKDILRKSISLKEAWISSIGKVITDHCPRTIALWPSPVTWLRSWRGWGGLRWSRIWNMPTS
jgi:hypothetical protein